MKVYKYIISMLVGLLFVAFVPNVEANEFTRIGGQDRYETAIEIAKKQYPTGSDKVVLARGDDFPDALSGAPLAKKLDAPILLTEKHQLTKDTKDLLQEWEPKEIIILGGDKAIYEQVETELKAITSKTSRIFGKDRYETAVKIANEVSADQTKAFLVTGEDFPDALSVAAYAAEKQLPILLSEQDVTDGDLHTYLSNFEQVYIVGGPAAISTTIERSLTSNVARIDGENRYETSINFLDEFYGTNEHLFMSTGAKFADALTGSVLAASQQTGVLLVDQPLLSDDLSQLFKELTVDSFTVFGLEKAVSDETMNDLAALLPNQSGLIEGKVIDQLNDVSIDIYKDDQIVKQTKTSPEGTFSIDLEEGDYTLQYQKQGFQPETVYDVAVSEGNIVKAPNIKLASTFYSSQGEINGEIIDVESLSTIKNATVNLRKGTRNHNGQIEKTIQSQDGTYVFNELDPGMYTIEVISDLYVTGYFSLSVNPGEQTNQDVYVSPILEEDQWKMVLTWDGQLLNGDLIDLDAHFTGPGDKGRFHVYWDQNQHVENNTLISQMNLFDDEKKKGIESVDLFHQKDNEEYRFYVFNYSYRLHNNSTALTSSNATIDVYKGNELKEQYYVPTDQRGKLWSVFTINGDKIESNFRVSDGYTFYSISEDQQLLNSTPNKQ
ncbi:cell wall-binding repeat-containing protein [Bacillus carboniphilus]|uniref:Cell wall-binding repeat-containing protein n=1 Tax=Bacillus carboniphilus TaxID=86663 RepID=A0ABY9JVC9_9BACI|nr:cell wall-binding repeat-containing protein [Bacillus carboniphilus]WLR41600.1 cell wall-binding repeat-containing protein [Bacillus carboniphilus]